MQYSLKHKAEFDTIVKKGSINEKVNFTIKYFFHISIWLQL